MKILIFSFSAFQVFYFESQFRTLEDGKKFINFQRNIFQSAVKVNEKF